MLYAPNHEYEKKNNAFTFQVWLEFYSKTVLGHMSPGWHFLATCCYKLMKMLPHVARMTLLGHMLPGWHFLATCCHKFMKMFGHTLPGWHCWSSLTWDMRLCRIHNIFLISHPPTAFFFSNIWTLFYTQNIPFQKRSRNYI